MKIKLLTLSVAVSFALFTGCGGTNVSKEVKSLFLSKSTVAVLDTTNKLVNKNEARYDGELAGGCDTSNHVVIDNPTNGTVILHDNGYYTYLANSSFQGSDSFSYKTDINSSCAPTVVDIDVNEQNSTFSTAPSDLNITMLCASELKFTWKDNSNNEDGFVIYQDGKPIAITDKNSLEAVINFKLEEGKSYNFEVRAKNSAGVSVGSSLVVKMVDGELILVKENVHNPVFVLTSMKTKKYDSSWTNFYTYDKNGNLLTDTNDRWQGNKFTYTYDKSGKLLTKNYDWLDNGSIEQTTIYVYDKNGNLASENTDEIDGIYRDVNISYTYNSNGNLIEKYEDYVRGWGDRNTTYTYDADGNMLTKSYKKNVDDLQNIKHFDTYTYDEDGNKIKAEINMYSDKGDSIDTIITYVYDDKRKLQSENVHNVAWNRDNKINYTYDNNGNLLKKEVDFDNDNTINTTITYIWEEIK